MKEKPKILFICSMGEVRSPTAVKLFGGTYLEKGLSGASPKTIRRLCKEADTIFVFEEIHVWTFKKFYPEFILKVYNLGIEDLWGKQNHPKLIEQLTESMDMYEYE